MLFQRRITFFVEKMSIIITTQEKKSSYLSKNFYRKNTVVGMTIMPRPQSWLAIIMRIAYADPPYIGQSARHYKGKEVDHIALIKRLEKYDAWALSCSSPSLKYILPMCPRNARVAAWVKPFAFFKPKIWPTYAWEPIVFVPISARTRKPLAYKGRNTFDYVSCKPLGMTPEERKNIVVHGAKPDDFCQWLFSILNVQPTDRFTDLFHGSGRVKESWKKFQSTNQ